MHMGETKELRSAGRHRSNRVAIAWKPILLVAILASATLVGGCAGIVTASGPTGTGSGAIQLNPTSVNFGNINVGKLTSQTVTIANTGTSSLNVTQATVSNSQFKVSGLTLPMSMSAGQSGTFTVSVTPTTSGSLAGTLTVQGDASSSPAVVNLSANAVTAAPQISLSTTAVNFGSVQMSTSGSSSLTISNAGNSDLTVSSVTISGAGFGFSGITTPKVISAGQSAPVALTFTPSAQGSATGALKISSNDTAHPTMTVALSGTGTTTPTANLSVSPASFNFGSIVSGQNSTKSFTVTNTGSASLTISQLSISATGYSVNGLSIPSTVAAGASVSFNAVFAPTTAGSLAGTVNIASNAPNSPTTVALSGTGVAATRTLSFSSSSLAFGNVNTSTPSTLTETITNTGNSAVQISAIAVSGTGYSLSGAGAVTLNPSQTFTFSVIFDPSAAGASNGSIAVTSNATGSPVAISLTGTGVAAATHSVSLTWNDSGSSIAGFNVYRSTTSGGGYVKVNGTLVPSMNYTDASVQNNTTYYYVTTAVDGSGNESAFSNEASAVVPN